MSYWYKIYKDVFDSKWIIITTKDYKNNTIDLYLNAIHTSIDHRITRYYILSGVAPRNYSLFSIKITNPIIINMINHNMNIASPKIFRSLIIKDLRSLNIDEEYKNVKNYKI